MLKTLLSKKTATSLEQRIWREGLRLDRSIGHPIQVEGNSVTLRLKTRADTSLQLIAFRKPDGSLGISFSSDDIAGIQNVNQLIEDIRSEIRMSQITLPNIRELVPGREEKPDEAVVKGDELRILYNNGYVSLQGNLGN